MKSIVALRRGKTGVYIPKFSECLLEYFGNNINTVRVNFSVTDGLLILENQKYGYELRHSPECPIKLISKSSNVSTYNKEMNVENLNIHVAASVIIESSDQHVLLTKRTPRMSSSPNVWVPPGGYLEKNEDVFIAGIREIEEETGLHVDPEQLNILGLWESTFPLLLGIGKPKMHVLIVYLHVLLNENHEKLTHKIIPNPDEVASYCWLSNSNIAYLSNSDLSCYNSKGIQFIVKNKKLVKQHLDYSTMFSSWLWQQPQPYSGVNYSLQKWIQKIPCAYSNSKL